MSDLSQKSTPPLPEFRAALIGSFAGFVLSLLGMGPGLIMVPSLHFLMWLPMKESVQTSLFLLVPVSLCSTIFHWVNKPPIPSYFWWVILGSIFGVRLGLFLRERLSQFHLKFGFFLFLILVLAKHHGILQLPVDIQGMELTLTHHLVLGFLASLLSATMGIGGGVVIVTAYLMILGQDAKSTTFLAIHVVLCNAVLCSYQSRKLIVFYPFFKWILTFGLIGALSGTLVYHHVEESVMKMIYGVFLIVVCIRMGISIASELKDRFLKT